MGGAIAADGSMEMQCQSCHGTMSQVGASNRTGWFMEPNCGSCHTGDAVNNAGLIRFTSVFTNNSGGVRVISNPLFASNPGTPAPQLSLYRFSSGHGGLQCSACHGSTHAEFPSTHRNDNLRNQALQGHAGVMAECTACHSAVPNTVNGGPHGMHPVGTNWVSTHPGLFDAGLATRAQCRVCHGTDYRGTVLSRAQADRSFSVFGGRSFFRGAIIGCYNCHNGPDSETANSSAAPTVANVITNTANDHALIIPVTVTGAGAVLKVISQPANGSVGVSSHTLTYYPAAGFVGTETFTYAAYDGAKNSSLGTATVSVTQGAVQIGAAAYVPPNYPAGMPVPFAVQPAVTNSAATPIFHWTFGDGSPGADGQFPTHTYAQTGSYTWSVVTQLSGKSATNSGTITLTAPITLKAVPAGGQMLTFSWPEASADLLLEQTAALGSQAQWTWVTNTPTHGGGIQTVTLQNTGTQFYRIRRPW
jgi:PKD repeat protein